jgi:transposase
MSQGHKEGTEPVLFLPGTDVYRHVKKTDFYERLSATLDLSFVRELTKPLYADGIGRPSLDPVIFFKCMLIAFFENITYDTNLEYRIADSLAFHRFLGYGLDERTPDESTLRKTRQKMPQEVFSAVFDYVLGLCEEHGLLKGRAVGTDSTLVDANAGMDSLTHKELGCSYEDFMLALRRQDDAEASKGEAIQADRKRKAKASNQDWKSKTDPDAKVMMHSDGHTHLSYKIDTTVDLETGVIVSTGADHANVSDQTDCLQRVDEAADKLAEHGKQIKAVVADKGHHSGANLAGLSERGLIALISSPSTGKKTPGFERSDFIYDEAKDCFRCPAGHILARRARKDTDSRVYQAKGSACRRCPHFRTCTDSKTGRSLSVPAHDDLIAANRARVHSDEARPLMQIRRQRGEAPFGYYKFFGGMRRMSGRGLDFAEKKTQCAGIGWNLLLLVKHLAAQPVDESILAVISFLLRLTGRLQTLCRRILGSLSIAGFYTLGSHPAVEFVLKTRRKACLSVGC